MATPTQSAADFEAIIQAARARKKNEALASKIFGNVTAAKSNSHRRESAPFTKTGPAASNFMASRAGVKKRASPAGPAPSNINGEWTHDLYARSAPSRPAFGQSSKRISSAPSSPALGSLAARVQDPRKTSLAKNALANRISTKPVPLSGNRNNNSKNNLGGSVGSFLAGSRPMTMNERRRQEKLAKALEREVAMQDAPPLQGASGPRAIPPLGPASMMSAPSRFNRGMSIRGMAGPYIVIAQNFAPGTTAADIESAMGPVGGVVESCRILKEWPIVTAEIVFESQAGADNVVATFNQQTADGRLLNVYKKLDNTLSKIQPPATQNPSTGVIDGSMGFDDPMETEMDDAYHGSGDGYSNGNGGNTGNTGNRNGNGYGRQQSQHQAQRPIPTGPAAMSGGGGGGSGGSGGGGNGGGLYSDRLVSGNRRGRGFSNRG